MKKLSTIICCLLSLYCLSQNKTFDLSKKVNISQSVLPQKITRITLVNGLAKAGTAYSVDIVVKHTPPPPLSIPTGVSSDAAAGGKGGACKPLNDATDALLKETSESNIPNLIASLQKEIKSAPAGCEADVKEANKAIDATTTSIVLTDPIVIGKGDEAQITISRDKNAWVFTFKNERVSHWTTYYGFTYVPDILTKFTNYYASEQAGGTYLISKMNSKNKNVLQNISPTVMFTYRFFDEKDPDKFLKTGITAGMMYNSEVLGAMFGPSLVFGDNVTVNTGISFVQKYRLKGQYVNGQTIQDNLDFDQLHDKIWTYDFFFSIGINLPSLFEKKSDKKDKAGSE